MGRFEEIVKTMNSSEILNYYRNCFYTEPNHTERGILANAINDILPKYVQYRDAEEQGLLLRLPCKVGDKVFWLRPNALGIPVEIKEEEFEYEMIPAVGSVIFLTREEAEKALEDMKGKV